MYLCLSLDPKHKHSEVTMADKCKIKPIEQYKIDPKKLANGVVSICLWNYAKRVK